MSPQTEPEKYLIARRIIAAAAEASGLHPAMIIGRDRSQGAVYWRVASMRAIREATEASYPFIGRMFGGRDHTTVIRALRNSPINMEDVQLLVKGLGNGHSRQA